MLDPKHTVRTGYDSIATRYLHARAGDAADLLLLDDLIDRLPDHAAVLDLGCGAGVPITQRLAERFNVTGVDISAAQVALARQHVPNVTFIQADMTALDFPDATFDAIVSYYAIIHIPRDEHPALLRNLHRMLKPGGLGLLSMGASDNPDDVEPDWLDAGAPMYWSHYDRDTNLRLLREAGFTILWNQVIMEEEAFGGGQHLFVLVTSG